MLLKMEDSAEQDSSRARVDFCRQQTPDPADMLISSSLTSTCSVQIGDCEGDMQRWASLRRSDENWQTRRLHSAASLQVREGCATYDPGGCQEACLR